MIPTTQDLERTLEAAVGPIQRIERQRCPYSSSYEIEELDVLLADGTSLAMIFKNVSPETAPDPVRIKPDFLNNPLREIETYRAVLSGRSLGTAKCFTTVSENGRYWIFLERIAGPHLWQTGDRDSWHNAARWLARLHQQPTSMTHLVRYDRPYYRRWWDRAVALHPELGPLAPVYARAAGHLMELPATFIHGEFFASNVLVAGDRICPIDWELAGCGPGLIDMAALTAGKWTAEDRREFLAAYCGAPPGDALLRSLDCCRFYLAVSLLGWSSNWRPPVAHAHDWTREALQIAEGLR